MITWHHIKTLMNKRMPGQLIIQYTDQCNAQCPQCGMRVSEKFPRSKMTREQILRTLDKAAENKVQALSFTGGEPLLYVDELHDYLRYAGSLGIPFLRTGTNGYHFRNPDSAQWEDRVKRVVDKLAATPVRNFWISVDSADPATHEEMRGFKGLIRGIEKALPIFHEAGLYPSANLGINRRVGGPATWDLEQQPGQSHDDYLAEFYETFKTSFRNFYQLVIDMGFTSVNCCYPMSVNPDERQDDLQAVYAATANDRIVKFSDPERATLFKGLFETIPDFRSKVRIFSPMTSLYALFKQYGEGSESAYGCRGGIDFFFIDSADGNTYPCGYRGNENLGKYEDLDLSKMNAKAACTDCDWECFRDPSELFGPILDSIHHPWQVAGRFARDWDYLKLWVKDLRYYRACDYFDARKPPRYEALAKFDPSRAYTKPPVLKLMPAKADTLPRG